MPGIPKKKANQLRRILDQGDTHKSPLISWVEGELNYTLDTFFFVITTFAQSGNQSGFDKNARPFAPLS